MSLCKKRFQYLIKNSAIQNLASQTLGIKSAALALLLMPCAVYAQTGNVETGKPIHFYHQDWEVACDNTRTCRAAGYQADDSDSFPVSVLFTRKAGAGQNVSGKVKLGTTDYVEGQPEPQSVQLIINNTSYGKVILNGAGLDGNLSERQVQTLIAALAGHTVIQFKSGKDTWSLSGQGAAAVLLKMDDVQGRVGTTGALLQKGKKTEASVLPSLPTPVVNWVKPDAKANAKPSMQRLIENVDLKQLKQQLVKQQQDLKQLLKKSGADYSTDECPVMTGEDQYAEFELRVEPLNNHQLLASGLCWRGAYNTGIGYWVINAKPPYQPKMVTGSASDYVDGVISSQQKGRGLGDCWSNATWTWNGNTFIQTHQATTGMCRMVELGGAWDLPTKVALVKRGNGVER